MSIIINKRQLLTGFFSAAAVSVAPQSANAFWFFKDNEQPCPVVLHDTHKNHPPLKVDLGNPDIHQAELNEFMCDRFTGAVIEMDLSLFQRIGRVVNSLRKQGHEAVHIDVVSGYRSKQTNDKMRAEGGGQAKVSQHSFGRANDFNIQGVKRSLVHKAAVETTIKDGYGGVGNYDGNNGFVHMDTWQNPKKALRFW